MRLRSLFRFLSSARPGSALVLVWALLLVIWVVPFHFYGLPMERIRAIITDDFFVVLYVAVLATTLLCLLPRSRRTIARATRVPSSDSRPAIPPLAVATGEWERERAGAALSAAGYRRVVSGDGWTWGVRWPYGPLGSLLFHASFLIVAAAVLVGYLAPGFSGSAVVAEGETFSGAKGQYKEIEGESQDVTSTVPSADATATPVSGVGFTVDSIEAEFFEDVLLFTRLDARVVTENGSPRTVCVGTPWFPSASTMVRLEDFGYALEVEDRFDPENPIVSAYKLNAFPSGVADGFEYADISPGSNDKYSFSVVIYGDYEPLHGAPGVASYNLSDPRVDVTVDRVLSNGEKRRIVDHEIVEPGTTLELPSGEFEIIKVTEWGRFTVTHLPAAPLMLLALLLAAAGVCLRMVFPRTEAVIARSGDEGGVIMAVRRDLYGQAPEAARRLASAYERGGPR